MFHNKKFATFLYALWQTRQGKTSSQVSLHTQPMIQIPKGIQIILSLIFYLLGLNIMIMLSSLPSQKAIEQYLKPKQWHSLMPESSYVAQIYTPYHLFPGGGERYLLTFAKVCQELGLSVSIIVKEGNVVSKADQVQSLAKQMGIPIGPISVSVVSSTAKIVPNKTVDIFFSIGNEKFPSVPGVGQKNLYMCQFPFDYNSSSMNNYLFSYDVVLVNSKYSLGWYVRSIMSAFKYPDNSSLRSLPDVIVVYPPVPITNYEQRYLEKYTNPAIHIVLLGRFFEGRQNKGHKQAIQIFSQMQRKAPSLKASLTLAGAQMRGRIEDIQYTESLYKLEPLKNVKFLLDYKDDELVELLTNAHVLWHLTGIESSHSDPASEEHFGISVVTAMNLGVIPIVFNGGAMNEIINDEKNGFLCETTDCIGETTIRLAALNQHFGLESIRQSAIASSKKFSENVFREHISRILIGSNILHGVKK